MGGIKYPEDYQTKMFSVVFNIDNLTLTLTENHRKTKNVGCFW